MSFIKQKLLFVGAVLILILAAVAFVFIPALGGSASGKILEFGKWNGKPIEYIEDTFFVRQFQYMANSLQEQGGELDQFNHYRVMRSAFSAAVLRLAILDELESAGYRPSQALINRYLLPYYMDQNGKYSARIFEETPEITRSQRRNLVTEELTAQRYIEDVFGTPDREFGLKISSKETELLAQMAGPQRSFNYVSFSTSDYPESEILSFGKANEDLFVKYSFTLVTADSLSAIKNVEKRISREEVSFDDAVVNYSTRIGTNEKGKLSKSLRTDINTLFSDADDLAAVLALAPGETSEPVMAGKVYALVRCDEAPVSPDFADAAVISAVRSYMNLNERGRIEEYFMNQAKAFAETARLQGFDNACELNGLQKNSTPHFSINFGNVELLSQIPVQSHAAFSEAVRNETFFKTAFSIPPASVSDPVLLGKEILVLQASEEKAADPQLSEIIALEYDRYASSWAMKTANDMFLSSDKLEDNFMETYLEYFLNRS
ncbi:MAG TPA: hypothetical protein PKW72_01940 [Treponemataceae bacterium]|nr:hypothetical protein [Treponemataceae bacterium]